MKNRTAYRTGVTALLVFLAVAFFSAKRANALQEVTTDDPTGSYSCQNDASGTVQCCVYHAGDPSCQRIATNISDTDANAGQCLGACGPGCSAINCGGGGACAVHDNDVLHSGYFSAAAMASFPFAATQWAACVVGKTVVSVGHVVEEIFHAAGTFINSVVSWLFN